MGTLAQLKNLLNRSTVPLAPKKNVHATEDFLQVVMEGYILTAALKHFKVESMHDISADSELVQSFMRLPRKDRPPQFEALAAKIIEPFIDFFSPTDVDKNPGDHVMSYAKTLLSLSLLWAEFEDATREGDGPHVMRCWKFLFLIFKDARRKNYAIEGFNLLASQSLLSPRQKEQLIWSRVVNYAGKPAANKAADLHMEHINRETKAALGSQRSNITPRAVARAGRAAGPLVNIATQFDRMSALHKPTGKHTTVNYETDLQRVIDVLSKAKVFDYTMGRRHEHVRTVKSSPFHEQDKKSITKWMKQRLPQVST